MGYLTKPFASFPFPSITWPATFGDLLDDTRATAPEGRTITWKPRVDILESDAAYFVGVELPGVHADDLKISVENDTLTIEGTTRRAEIGENQSWRLMERREGTFRRSFSFPVGVDAEDVTADLENGVLTVRIMKAKEAQPRVIKVNAR